MGDTDTGQRVAGYYYRPVPSPLALAPHACLLPLPRLSVLPASVATPLSLMSLLPTFSILGSGPTVLMLHDADGGHLSFAPQVETLASAGYRAVAWDMPGYGHSAPVEPYGFLGLARRCILLIETLECQQLALVGHGLGAMLALEVALRIPERVERLLLCAGGPPLDARALAAWQAPREKALAAGGSMEQIASLLVPQHTGTGALPEGVRLAEHAFSQVHRATYARAVRVLSEFDRSAADFRRIAAPLLVVGGADDRAATPATLDAWAQLIPGAERLTLAGAGHWPQLEAPEAFDAALLQFLSAPKVLH